MNDEQLLRYSRQIFLPEIDLDGQARLLDARVAIIGLGGLGSPVAMYLAAAGVGELVLVDFDRVELSNLQRQIMHQTEDIGKLKVDSARSRLLALNPECQVTTCSELLDEQALLALARRVAVVVDCTDNFTARYAINNACVQTKTALVSAAAIRFEAQISVFCPAEAESPCYACLYPGGDELAETCTQAGVVAPLLGIIGSMQALETIKLITGAGVTLLGRLLVFDALTLEWQSLRLRKDPHCQVCGSR
jgi:molybdopterin-synthase adenylyltransferase